MNSALYIHIPRDQERCYDECNTPYLDTLSFGQTPIICIAWARPSHRAQACRTCLAAPAPCPPPAYETYNITYFQTYFTYCGYTPLGTPCPAASLPSQTPSILKSQEESEESLERRVEGTASVPVRDWRTITTVVLIFLITFVGVIVVALLFRKRLGRMGRSREEDKIGKAELHAQGVDRTVGRIELCVNSAGVGELDADRDWKVELPAREPVGWEVDGGVRRRSF